ncbi:hypothetical protein [Chryseobacterium sp.]|uniref:hypothetical protein n=1 Tax=Chryseobacterium sp. TaxID=1871047 RepID=UPI00289D05A4|nr:hypothetical protein [Chryseobacterium sp.]
MMKIFQILLLGILLFSCKEASKNNLQKQGYSSNNKTEEILENQIMNGYAIKEKGLDMISDYKYKKEDYDAIKSLSIDILKKNGFNLISNEEFQNKLKTIFKVEVEKNDLNFLIEYPCTQDKTVYQIDGNYVVSNNNPIFIDSQNKFLLEPLFIPQLIDYKSQYPAIHQKEKNIPKEKLADGTNVDIIKWADVKELNEIQFTNNQRLIHRNKYLFNDVKASLTWLKFNDKLFLESLVKTFGYTKDKSLLTFVLRNNYKSIDELQKVLWNERCSEDIIFNKEVFEIITEAPEQEQADYLRAIADYLVKEMGNNSSTLDRKSSVKAEILGKIAYYSTKIGEKHNMYYDFFSILGSREGGAQFEEEFRKNNYYGISDFKQIWEETRTGGVSGPGAE